MRTMPKAASAMPAVPVTVEPENPISEDGLVVEDVLLVETTLPQLLRSCPSCAPAGFERSAQTAC